MKIETANGMILFKEHHDAFTGARLSGLRNMPIYIEIDDNKDYDRFWVTESSYYAIYNIFNMFNSRVVDVYLSFEDVQNVKKNLGVAIDKRSIEAELEEAEPFREYWWNEFANEQENSLYD